jgi:hypothetical protein
MCEGSLKRDRFAAQGRLANFLTNVRGKACHEKSGFSFALMRPIQTHFLGGHCNEFITNSLDASEQKHESADFVAKLRQSIGSRAQPRFRSAN